MTAQSDEPPFVAMVRRHNWWGSSSCLHTYPSRPNSVPSVGVPVPTARDLPGESYSKDQMLKMKLPIGPRRLPSPQRVPGAYGARGRMLKMKPPISPGRLPSPRRAPGAHGAILARRVSQQGPDAQNEDSLSHGTATEPSACSQRLRREGPDAQNAIYNYEPKTDTEPMTGSRRPRHDTC